MIYTSYKLPYSKLYVYKEVWKERKEREAREKKLKKKGTIEVKKVVEEWVIWDKEEAAKSEEETKKLIPQGSTSRPISLERRQVRGY